MIASSLFLATDLCHWVLQRWLVLFFMILKQLQHCICFGHFRFCFINQFSRNETFGTCPFLIFWALFTNNYLNEIKKRQSSQSQCLEVITDRAAFGGQVREYSFDHAFGVLDLYWSHATRKPLVIRTRIFCNLDWCQSRWSTLETSFRQRQQVYTIYCLYFTLVVQIFFDQLSALRKFLLYKNYFANPDLQLLSYRSFYFFG